jgi:general stress protein 26
MSGTTEGFSNAQTGSKPADPYKAKNLDTEVPVKQKVEDLGNFLEGCKFFMMTTRQNATGHLVSRCMALAGREHGLDLIFHTNTESGKTDELHNDPNINISVLNNSGEWASISGEASIETDRETVKKHYSPALKAWIGDLGDGTHDGGPDDPRIGVIKVNAITATYAISHRTAVGRGVEIAKGVITGDAPNVHKLREISQEEMQQYKKLAGA